MFCSNCGNTINEGDKFCTNCGQPVKNNTSVNNSLSNNQYDFDVSSFGNNKIAACKYVSKTYNLSLSEAKKIVDQKYDELKAISKDLKKKFICTKRIGSLEIDSQNRLFKVNGAKKDAFIEKKKHGLFSNMMALSSFGITRALENSASALSNSSPEQIYNFDDINSFELLEDNNIVTSGGLGTSLAATFLTGSYAAGAAGAVFGKKTSKKEINMMTIKLNMNNVNNAYVMIPIIAKKTKTDSKEYKEAYNLAQQILSTLNAMLNN